MSNVKELNSGKFPSNCTHLAMCCGLEILELRNLVMQTIVIASKWFELGLVLYVPINKLEGIYNKYNDDPMKALIRVCRYWLADKNGLKPSWENLLLPYKTLKSTA